MTENLQVRLGLGVVCCRNPLLRPRAEQGRCGGEQVRGSRCGRLATAGVRCGEDQQVGWCARLVKFKANKKEIDSVIVVFAKKASDPCL